MQEERLQSGKREAGSVSREGGRVAELGGLTPSQEETSKRVESLEKERDEIVSLGGSRTTSVDDMAVEVGGAHQTRATVARAH